MAGHVLSHEVLRRSRWFDPRARLHYVACSCGWYDIRWTQAEVERRGRVHQLSSGESVYGPLRSVSDQR